MEAARDPGVSFSMTAAEIGAAVERAGLDPLTHEVAGRLQVFLELLQKWNARLNLTAIRDPEEILQRHFIECIFAARHLPAEIRTLLDFGSGGGFPGIPIALCRPEIQVTLGESQSKKSAFLRETVRSLGILNAEVYNGRVEGLEGRFEGVTLRAVDKMQEACREAIHLVAPSGYLVLFLSDEAVKNTVSVFDQFRWDAPILLPASQRRELLIGQKSS
jgi:16S rRNA (guanine527-N7)-methyltransferase